MALPTVGQLALSQLHAEFGGGYSLSNYYRGGPYVPNSSANAAIPTSGAIALSQFRGASRATPGSAAYTSPGVYYFTVPYYNSLTADVRGAGGGGGGYTTSDYYASPPRAADGGYSYFNAPTGNLVGYGGQGGEYGWISDDTGFYTGANGAHGSGVNGDYNGYADGAGGGSPAYHIYVSTWRGGYGGNGARAYRTWYANGPLVPGSVIQIVVGAGGGPGAIIHTQPEYGVGAGGGGGGAVYISWS